MTDFDQFSGQNNENLSTVLKIVSFCFPIVGLILWITKKDKEPIAAKSAGKFAIFGFIFGILFYIIMMVIGIGSAVAR